MSNRGEQKLLKQSTVLMFAVAIAGIVTGFISGSESIMFDGFFSLIATFIKVLMLITAQLIAKESNQRFQFGFWHLEPMVLLIEGSFLLLIAIYAFLNGVFGIINGGRDIELGLVIVYAAVFTVVEFAYYFWVKRKNRKLKSTLIQFDNVSWLVDAMLSVGLLISFLTALALTHQGYAQWAAYVDPAILIVLALSMLAPAFKILKPALRDVLGIAPDALDDKVREALEIASARHGFEGYKTYVQKHGRARFIEIHIVLPSGYPLTSVKTLDALREEIAELLGKADSARWLTISFTGDRRWIA